MMREIKLLGYLVSMKFCIDVISQIGKNVSQLFQKFQLQYKKPKYEIKLRKRSLIMIKPRIKSILMIDNLPYVIEKDLVIKCKEVKVYEGDVDVEIISTFPI